MSQLLEQARQLITANKADDEQHIRSAEAEVVRIALRDLTGKTLPTDAAELVELLEETGWTEEHYKDILAAAARVAECQEHIDECRKLEPLVAPRRQALKYLKKRHEAELATAKREFNQASSAAGRRMDAEMSIARIARNHPYLFANPGDSHGYGATPLPEVANFKPPVVEPAPQPAPEPVQEAPAEPEAVAVPEPAPTPAPAKRSRHNLPSID